jgi:redox-sensing transcriptional repressor
MPVSHDTIERLSRYRAVLRRLKALGLVRLFSDNLGDAAGVSASQVRKDFQLFGIHGVRRGGYRIDDLAARFDELLGADGPMHVVVVGCGHIGGALMRTYGVARDGVSIVAGFDVDPAVLNPAATPPLLAGRELPAFIRQHGIRVAIIAVPEQAVAGVVEQLRGTGVRGILNFAPVPLRN